MQGDHRRYLAELSAGADRGKSAQDAHDSFQSASEIAMTNRPATHPVPLGLALTSSVFFHEVFGSPEEACFNLTVVEKDRALTESGERLEHLRAASPLSTNTLFPA